MRYHPPVMWILVVLGLLSESNLVWGARCSDLVYWNEPERFGYRTAASLPRLYADGRHIHVLVYVGDVSPILPNGLISNFDYIEHRLRYQKAVRRVRNQALFSYEIVAGNKFPTLGKFRKHFRRHARAADVIFFFGHSNPFLVALSPHLHVRSEDLSEVDLQNKTLFFWGCNSGRVVNPYYGEEFRGDPVVGLRIPSRVRLIDGLMQSQKPKAVVGSTDWEFATIRRIDLFLERTLGDGGGSIFAPFRTVVRRTKDRWKPAHNPDRLRQLRQGNLSQKIEYIDAILPWHRVEVFPDSQFGNTMERWMLNPSLPQPLTKRVFEYFLEDDRAGLFRLIARMQPEHRQKLLDLYLSEGEKAGLIEKNVEVFRTLAGDITTDFVNFFERIDSRSRTKLFLNQDFLGLPSELRRAINQRFPRPNEALPEYDLGGLRLLKEVMISSPVDLTIGEAAGTVAKRLRKLVGLKPSQKYQYLGRLVFLMREMTVGSSLQ